MQSAHGNFTVKTFAECRTVLFYIFQIRHGVRFNLWADNIGLVPGGDFPFDVQQCLRSVFFFNDGVFNRVASGGTRVNHRAVEIPVENHSERPRNRCRAHHQYMRQLSFGSQLLALQDAEAVLFIRHNQCKCRKNDSLFQ